MLDKEFDREHFNDVANGRDNEKPTDEEISEDQLFPEEEEEDEELDTEGEYE